MAKATPELKRVVKRYRTQLQKMGIRPTRVLLYGSQAAGTAREGSDIDLIIISGDWKKYNHRQRLELLGIAAARILEPVQAQGFTPNENERYQPRGKPRTLSSAASCGVWNPKGKSNRKKWRPFGSK